MRARFLQRGVTLLELIVVLVIVSLLSTIAVGIYTKEILRAKIAKTRAEIRTLEVAINRYQIDLGQYPPSSSGTQIAPNALDQANPFRGTGYLQLALRASLNGNSNAALSSRWVGPYMDWDENRLGTLTGVPITASTDLPQIVFVDPFDNPYHYVNSKDYTTLGGTFLPTTSPYFATETYFNPSTVQIISTGPDGTSDATPNQWGTQTDDVTNWESPNI